LRGGEPLPSPRGALEKRVVPVRVEGQLGVERDVATRLAKAHVLISVEVAVVER
jgi:hypothetical protein